MKYLLVSMSVKQNLFVSVFVHKWLIMLNGVEYTTVKMVVTKMSNYLFVISFQLTVHKTLRYRLARPLYFKTQQTVIQSTPVADFSFDFTEGSFSLLNSQKRLRSVAEDLKNNNQKRTERIYQERRRHAHYKTLKPIFLNRL